MSSWLEQSDKLESELRRSKQLPHKKSNDIDLNTNYSLEGGIRLLLMEDECGLRGPLSQLEDFLTKAREYFPKDTITYEETGLNDYHIKRFCKKPPRSGKE